MKKILALCMLGAFAFNANAAFISGPDIIAAPLSVEDDTTVNTHQQGFNEQQNVTLTSDLAVDGGTISAGTVVSSHMIFLNSKGTTDIFDANEIWKFDGDILGVMSDVGGTLEAASNSLFAAPGTTYPGAFANRGLEGGGDGYTVVGNTLTLSMHVTEPGDWIRVITVAAVPEPSTYLLFGLGIFGLIAVRKRAQKS